MVGAVPCPTQTWGMVFRQCSFRAWSVGQVCWRSAVKSALKYLCVCLRKAFSSQLPEEKAFLPVGSCSVVQGLSLAHQGDKKPPASHSPPLAVPGWCSFNHQLPVFEKVSISLLNY